MASTTIDEVLDQLEIIIRDSIRTGNRAGYFAALYYKVTSRVKEGIANNEFQDGKRMERLDVRFANRYLDALAGWRSQQAISSCWSVAFNATAKGGVLVLQQLLLGMNAHINLDLGIAAVEIVGGKDLQAIQNDFNSINTIIAALTYEVVNDIDRVSPLLSLLGLHATNYESILIQFSISNARDGAWAFAESLCGQNAQGCDKAIKDRDQAICNVGLALLKPPGMMRLTIWIIHLFEWKNPSRITSALHEYKKKFFSQKNKALAQ
jgi:Family of unknown function (DUF5995)